jgi:hypothetical protein
MINREGQVVFVCHKYFWQTKTQLAMFAETWNLHVADLVLMNDLLRFYLFREVFALTRQQIFASTNKEDNNCMLQQTFTETNDYCGKQLPQQCFE